MFLSAQPVKLVMPCRSAFFSHFLMIKIARHFQHSNVPREGFPWTRSCSRHQAPRAPTCFHVSTLSRPFPRGDLPVRLCGPIHAIRLFVRQSRTSSERGRRLSFFSWFGTVLRALPVLTKCRFPYNIRIHPHYALNRLTSSAPPPSRRMGPPPPVLLPA